MADKEPHKIDYDKPISAETLLQLINSSIQSGKPLSLRAANLTAANLRGVNLERADLTNADLTSVRYDTDTKWREGFDPEAAGGAGGLTRWERVYSVGMDMAGE